MFEEGYAAVTSRRVAAKAGLKPQLVHYYFLTMDDLYLELFRRGAERNLARQAEALASDRPLRALWEFSNEPAGTTLTVEFAALANHRKAIRSEVAEYAERFRKSQTDALSGLLLGYGVDPEEVPTVVLLFLMSAVARTLSMEEDLGLSIGHAETVALVEKWLDRLEDQPADQR